MTAEKKQYKTKCLIIGSGPAGCTAAVYAARANLAPIMVRGLEPGGQLTITTDVENYPGFADVIQGPWLMEQMSKQAENVGTELVSDYITQIDHSKRPFKCYSESGAEFIADTIIISTGAKAKWLGLESESKFMGAGVSSCATCDGFFYKNKPVMVVGGGNTAAEEALFLTNFASKVYLIHRRDSLRAEQIMQKRLFDNPNIEIIWDHVLHEVLGDEGPLGGVSGATIKSTKNDEYSHLEVEGVFIAIGHKPNTDLFKGILTMDEENYILTEPDSTKTNIKGIYASGDVQDKIYRQAVTAAGTGCMAALEAERYLNFGE
jgi:thioredoxin reductase (NADPH)